MKPPVETLRAARMVPLLFVIPLFLAGCGRDSSSTPPVATPDSQRLQALGIEEPETEEKPDRLTWNLRTLSGAYDLVGKHDIKWDDSARKALEGFARLRSSDGPPEAAEVESVRTNSAAAAEAGCHDPLVAYLRARYELSHADLTAAELGEVLKLIAEALNASEYPRIRKFYAALRAAEQLKFVAGTNTPPEVHHFRRMAVTNLKRALEDRSMPIQEVDDACRDIFLALERNHGAYEETYRGIERLLFQNWPNESVPWFIKGKFYTKFAWIARGGGYADTVTEAGWKLMAERLKEAEAALLRAWQLNPKDPRIATAMITVELGQGRGKAHMESWFERAMEVDPNNFEACEAKRYYLEPKWHGSTLEMLAFGRECVRSTQWGGRVPLVLVDAHEALARYLDEEDRPEYWLQPQVWHDLKSAYDKFFELNPNATGWRHNYARHAYQCGKWAVFLDMLPSLGSVNYDFFGGQTEFESMVRSAREHVSDQ